MGGWVGGVVVWRGKGAGRYGRLPAPTNVPHPTTMKHNLLAA